MAAATRIESADEDAKLVLALQYSLLTDRTNFIVVHARAEGEKAQALPELRTIAQMHAAGWGGVGSVSESRKCCFMDIATQRTNVGSGIGFVCHTEGRGRFR